jgi:hypothetical protein
VSGHRPIGLQRNNVSLIVMHTCGHRAAYTSPGDWYADSRLVYYLKRVRCPWCAHSSWINEPWFQVSPVHLLSSKPEVLERVEQLKRDNGLPHVTPSSEDPWTP